MVSWINKRECRRGAATVFKCGGERDSHIGLSTLGQGQQPPLLPYTFPPPTTTSSLTHSHTPGLANTTHAYYPTHGVYYTSGLIRRCLYHSNTHTWASGIPLEVLHLMRRGLVRIRRRTRDIIKDTFITMYTHRPCKWWRWFLNVQACCFDAWLTSMFGPSCVYFNTVCGGRALLFSAWTRGR